MNYKIFSARSLLVTVMLLSGVGVQAATGDWYVGLGYGLTSFDTGISSTTGTASLDEDDSGFKFFGGYNVNKNVAIELAYADLGTASLSGNTGDTFVLDGIPFIFTGSGTINIDGSLIGLSGVFTYHFNDAFNLYGRAGLASWEADISATETGGPTETASEDGTDFFLGFGAGWNFAQTWALKAEYELYSFDSEDVDFLSLNIVKTF